MEVQVWGEGEGGGCGKLRGGRSGARCVRSAGSVCVLKCLSVLTLVKQQPHEAETKALVKQHN